jgi:Ca2+-binding EF-hand superfamily protein
MSLSNEQFKVLRQAFHAEAADGMIDLIGACQLAKRAGIRFSKQERAKLLARYPVDTRRLDFSHFIVLVTNKVHRDMNSTLELFRQLDTDNDGFISQTDLLQEFAPSMSTLEIRKLIDLTSQKISFQEFARLFSSSKHQA